MPDIRPPFEPPLLPSTLRFGSDPNLCQQGSNPLLDPLAAHRKMMGLRPAGFQPTSTGKQLLLLLLILWSHLSSPSEPQPLRDGRPDQRARHRRHHQQGQGDPSSTQRRTKGEEGKSGGCCYTTLHPPKPYQNYSKSSIVVGVNVNLLVCFFIEMLTLRT